MARKPQSPTRTSSKSRSLATKSSQTSDRRTSGEASLRRDLASARARIAELEKNQRDLSRRIETAIATIHKLLAF